MGVLLTIGQLTLFFLPAGVANMSPVFFRRSLRVLDRPVDGGRQWHGQALFGNHKTWRGMVVATVCGGLFFLVLWELAYWWPMTSEWYPFAMSALPWWFGFLFSAGAITGDLVKSFFKRRVGVSPGVRWFPFDQLDFLIGAAVVAEFFVDFTVLHWIIIVLVGPVLHVLVNHIGFTLRLKDTPW